MHKLYLHPLPVRIWHWINALTCVVMLLTGIQLRYIGLVSVVPFNIAVAIHNWSGFILIGNFFVWLIFYLTSVRIKVYHTRMNPVEYFLGCLRQALYYGYGILKQAPAAFHPTPLAKFNPLQLVTYQMIMLMLLPVQAITGVLLWDLNRFAPIVALLGGIRVIDTVHVLIFIFFAAYIPAHMYLGTLGHTTFAHYKEMVTGYAEEEGEEAEVTE